MLADLTIKEVEPPRGLVCKSGHVAPAFFRRQGTKAPEEPIKFFRVSAKDPNVCGIYCEPCLIVANAMTKMNINPK